MSLSWRQVPIQECGEPLVQLTGLLSHPWHYRLGRDGALNEVWLRTGAVERLLLAERYLPRDIRLLVLDGWRPAALHQRIVQADQQELQDHPELDDTLDPRDLHPEHPAPSLTGGRVGVTLCDPEGQALDMGSVVRRLCPQAHTYHYAGADTPDEQQLHARRLLLLGAMTRAGFSADAGAWWRYQCGTQQHHARVGGPAPYGLVAELPPGHRHAFDQLDE